MTLTKNWLFVGEAGASQRGAVLYSVIESCRRRNIDPYADLLDVLTRLTRLPANWANPADIPSRLAA